MAKARLDAKQYGEAIELLEKVVRLQPSSESAHYSLMMAYRNAGRTADAAAQQAALDKLRQAPEGEFTDFLKRLGDKAHAGSAVHVLNAERQFAHDFPRSW